MGISRTSRIGEERFRREHECEFIIYDETLISPLQLVEMQGVDHCSKMGEARWYEQPTPNHMYSLTLDPSSGTGGDNAAIQVMNVPTMTQVGEWAHNRTPVEGQMRVLMEMMQYLVRDAVATNLYWTVENNSIGEAALVVIRDTGEENFPGDFLHDPKKDCR